jgi:hypothetical protein
MTSRKGSDAAAGYLNEIKITSNKTLDRSNPMGAKFIDDAGLHDEGFYAIQGINSAKLDVSDCVFGGSMEDFDADFVIPNGAVIYGNFKTVSLDSGSCIAYKK